MTDSKSLSNTGKVISLIPITGELLGEARLAPLDVAYMNFAREEFSKLAKILLTQILPALGGYDNELACDIARHLDQVRSFSGNFCWRHRQLGASEGEVGKGDLL